MSKGNSIFTHESTMAQAAAAIKAIPKALTEFRYPTCNTTYSSLIDLKNHCTGEHPDAVVPETVLLSVNGKDCQVLIEPHWTLKRALQFRLGLTGAKHMCDRGVCGSCTVIMDKRAVLACTTLAVECEGHEAILDKNPNPSEEAIREGLSGNICICGTYPRHSTAILEAAIKMSKEACSNG